MIEPSPFPKLTLGEKIELTQIVAYVVTKMPGLGFCHVLKIIKLADAISFEHRRLCLISRHDCECVDVIINSTLMSIVLWRDTFLVVDDMILMNKNPGDSMMCQFDDECLDNAIKIWQTTTRCN